MASSQYLFNNCTLDLPVYCSGKHISASAIAPHFKSHLLASQRVSWAVGIWGLGWLSGLWWAYPQLISDGICSLWMNLSFDWLIFVPLSRSWCSSWASLPSVFLGCWAPPLFSCLNSACVPWAFWPWVPFAGCEGPLSGLLASDGSPWDRPLHLVVYRAAPAQCVLSHWIRSALPWSEGPEERYGTCVCVDSYIGLYVYVPGFRWCVCWEESATEGISFLLTLKNNCKGNSKKVAFKEFLCFLVLSFI